MVNEECKIKSYFQLCDYLLTVYFLYIYTFKHIFIILPSHIFAVHFHIKFGNDKHVNKICKCMYIIMNIEKWIKFLSNKSQAYTNILACINKLKESKNHQLSS